MKYTNTATSKNPAHIIYVIDASGSMAGIMHGTKKSKIDFVSDVLEEVAYQIYARSKRGSVVSERYRLAIFAYNSRVFDLTNGDYISTKEFLQGIPEFGSLPQSATNTFDALTRVRDLLKKTIATIDDNYPPPLVCHITDGEYSGEYGNPSEIMNEIMNLETPDGKVLLENIYLGENILSEPIIDARRWRGISNPNAISDPYAKFLYDHSSVWPNTYTDYLHKGYGYNISPGSKMFFPAESIDIIKIAFTATTATPTGTNIRDDTQAESYIESDNTPKSGVTLPHNKNNVQSFNIHNLFFGSDDAEYDEKNGFLSRVFLKTSIYNHIIRSHRELVVGRKGSGKSAICLMLKNALEEDGIKTLIITPKLLSPSKIEPSRTDSINQEEMYLLLWKYTLLVSVGRKVYGDYQSTRKKNANGTIKLVRSFLVENEEIAKTIFEQVSDKLNFISKFTIKAFGIEGSAEMRQLQAKKDFVTELESFQSNLEIAFEKLRFVNYVVMIDKVDDVWSQTKESEMMIVGLIKAVHELNTIFQKAHFILFLRSDIYDNIFKFNDADKFHSVEERIHWSETNLKHLIVNRGRVSLDLPSSTTVDAVWNAIFDEKIRGASTFDYIVNRTLHRPRDIIQFCNVALSYAQNNNHQFITADDISLAEKQYSFWKLKDAISEFAVQYPFLEQALALFYGFKNKITYTEFEVRFNSIVSPLPKDSELGKVKLNTLLQILFDIGFLGVELNSKAVYQYDDLFVVLSDKNTFLIHPAYHLALGLSNRVEVPKS